MTPIVMSNPQNWRKQPDPRKQPSPPERWPQLQAVPIRAGEYGVWVASWREGWDEAVAKARALVPADATGIKEFQNTKCSGCGDEWCPNEKAVFAVRWKA